MEKGTLHNLPLPTNDTAGRAGAPGSFDGQWMEKETYTQSRLYIHKPVHVVRVFCKIPPKKWGVYAANYSRLLSFWTIILRELFLLLFTSMLEEVKVLTIVDANVSIQVF
jgi:hypothetical protein